MGTQHPQTGERFTPYQKFFGFFVPNVLAKSGLCTPVQLLIYGRMCQFSGKNGQCFMSYQTLAHELCISRYSVVQNVKKLIKKGLIERESRAGQTTCFYFLWHPVFDTENAADQNKKVVQAEDKLDKNIAQPPGQPSCPPQPQFTQDQKHTQKTPAGVEENQPGPSQFPSPGGKTSGAGKDKQAGPQLSPLEEEYTELVLDCMQAEGKIQKNRHAVKSGIQKKILAGEVVVTDAILTEYRQRHQKLRKNTQVNAWENRQRALEEIKVEIRKAVEMEPASNLQKVCDQVVLHRQQIGNVSLEDTKSALLSLYPDEYKISEKKAQLRIKSLCDFRGLDEKLKALNELKKLDLEFAAKVEQETDMDVYAHEG